MVLGPGSWFTSVLPHLLVPDLATALATTMARRILILNLAPQPGETAVFSPEQHLRVLCDHAPAGFTVHAVLADTGAVAVPTRLHRCAAALGGHAYLDRVAQDGSTDRHDPVELAAALRRILMDTPDDGSRMSRPRDGSRMSCPHEDKSELEREEKRRWP